MAYDMLDAINNGKDSWKVKVRVISLWDVVNLNNNELISLDMTLLDEQGTMIHAKVMKHMVNNFRPLIQEGLVYMMENFKY
uniref:Replication protein A 70 kDa DNA-binding subunit B/D first OB fold domain-containing protein n=1 Tax=Aegilops tauschii subsp. strangulata TaxID=200361 RepID=A0A453RV51_AEGTS